MLKIIQCDALDSTANTPVSQVSAMHERLTFPRLVPAMLVDQLGHNGAVLIGSLKWYDLCNVGKLLSSHTYDCSAHQPVHAALNRIFLLLPVLYVVSAFLLS